MTNIRKLRAALGWTQKRLADELKTTVTTISRWENGQARPTGGLMLEAIAKLVKSVDLDGPRG